MQTLPPPKSPDSAASLGEVLNNSKLRDIVKKARFFAEVNRLLVAALESELAAHCRTANYQQGCLLLEVDSAAWATRLRFSIPQLIPTLRLYPLLTDLQDIRCKIRPQSAVPVIATSTPEPLSSDTVALIENAAANIQDVKLKAALQRLAEGQMKVPSPFKEEG